MCSRVTNGSGKELYCALFFLSGKLLLLSGNFVHYSLLELPATSYTHESCTAVPPFKKVRHNRSSLDEYIGGHSLRRTSESDGLTMQTDFSKLHATFHSVPEKNCIFFRDVIGGNFDKRKFDWYLQPRCSVTVCLSENKADTLFGNGHFQQFWGDNGEANCDWIVLHLQSGYDMVIARFPEDKKKRAWLPGDYILLSGADGETRKITGFSMSVTDWWKSVETKKKYPLTYAVTASQQNIALTVKALKPDQKKNIAGKEFWYGFGSVTGSIDGADQRGWAYLAPLGVSE